MGNMAAPRKLMAAPRKLMAAPRKLMAAPRKLSDMACRYDIGVTQKLNSKGMTHKGGKRKAGPNKSILSVGFGTLNQMLTYKIEQKSG
jgi:putative transposase